MKACQSILQLLNVVWLYIFLGIGVESYGQLVVTERLSSQEGLTFDSYWANKSVDIDAYGYSWISTSNGLNRFDGYEITNYLANGLDSTSIPFNSLSSIAIDKKSNIWFGTAFDGLFKYDYNIEKFTRIQTDKMQPDGFSMGQINDLIVDDDNRLWIVLPFKGIYVLDENQNTLKEYNIKHRVDVPKNFVAIEKLSDGRLVILASTSISVGDYKNGFSYYPLNNVKGLFRVKELNNEKLLLLDLERAELYYFDLLSEEYSKIDRSFESRIYGINVVDEEHVLIGNLHSSFLYNWKLDHIVQHIPDVGVLDVKKSEEDLLYMTNANGAGKIKYSNVAIESIVKSRNVGKIEIDEDQNLFYSIGHELYQYNENNDDDVVAQCDKEYSIFNFNTILSDSIYLVTVPNNYGDVTLILKPQILLFDDAGNKKWESVYFKLFNYINPIDDQYLGIEGLMGYEDDQDPIKNHINHKFKSPLKIIDEIKGINTASDNSSKHYRLMKNGELWVSTISHGLVVVNPSRDGFKQYFASIEKGKLPTDGHYYIYESQNEDVFLLADNGVIHYDRSNNSFESIDIKKLDLSPLSGIVESKNGIWIMSKKYFYRYDLISKSISVYQLELPHYFRSGQPNDMIVDSIGRIYYVGQEGVMRFDPSRFTDNTIAPKFVFSDLYVDRNRIYPQDSTGILDSTIIKQDQFNLKYEQRDLGFKFSAIEGKKHNITYYYQLDGYDDKWHEVDESREVHFLNLNPGKYVFRVKMKDGNQHYISEVPERRFSILPPWYLTWWAYMLYGILLFGILYAIYKYRLYQVTKYERLRQKISRDLHDDVGTLLTSLAMQSEILSMDAQNERVGKLERISQMSRVAMERMRDTVWAIDSSQDHVESLCDRIADYVAEVRMNRSDLNIDFQLSHIPISDKLSPDVRRNIYLIFKEALNNALKYSTGDLIEVKFQYVNTCFVLSVTNNGDAHHTKLQKTSGQGLKNMEKRARDINGHLSIERSDNSYSVVLKV